MTEPVSSKRRDFLARACGRRLRCPLLLILLGMSALLEAASPPSGIQSDSAILIDAKTGAVLYEKNPDEPRPVASTQKLLTALIVVEEGDLDGLVTVEESDTRAEPTKFYIKAGEQYTRRHLVTGLLVKSANDVAVALARDNAGSVEAFVEKMNARAQQLGMTRSTFRNPNGLPAEGQVSTARDMVRLAYAAYHNPKIRAITDTEHFTFEFPDGRELPVRNTNRVLRTEPWCNGMKTGYTHASRHCLVASGKVNGREVIAVLLGNSKFQIVKEANNLLRFGLGLPLLSGSQS